MARIKLAYLGGGSSRAAGTMASLIWHGKEFEGSEISLIDLDPDHLEIVRSISEKMIADAGIDMTVTATTDRRAGLEDVDAVLSSFRPGGFAARALDERIPRQARCHRPGDAGRRRLLHVAALGQRAQGRRGRPQRRRPEREDLQLHEPGQHRRPGGHAVQRRRTGVDVRRPHRVPAGDPEGRRSRPRACAASRWPASTTTCGAPSTSTTAKTSCRCSSGRGRSARTTRRSTPTRGARCTSR